MSSFLEAEGKKDGTVTTGRPCTLFTIHACLIVWRMCLVGVKTSALSRRDWVLHDSWILVIVAMVGPHVVRRVFHIPLVMVHPSCGWARVVSPSLVILYDVGIGKR